MAWVHARRGPAEASDSASPCATVHLQGLFSEVEPGNEVTALLELAQSRVEGTVTLVAEDGEGQLVSRLARMVRQRQGWQSCMRSAAHLSGWQCHAPSITCRPSPYDGEPACASGAQCTCSVARPECLLATSATAATHSPLPPLPRRSHSSA
jgi:hypothetical protein